MLCCVTTINISVKITAIDFKDKLENIKVIFLSRKWKKDRQYNDKRRVNNDLQNTRGRK